MLPIFYLLLERTFEHKRKNDLSGISEVRVIVHEVMVPFEAILILVLPG